jgi:hypothetical protein
MDSAVLLADPGSIRIFGLLHTQADIGFDFLKQPFPELA